MGEKLSRPWQVCAGQAWDAYCPNCNPFGNAVTDSDGRDLSVGRNKDLRKVNEKEDQLLDMPLADAENSVVISLNDENVDPRSAIRYTTSEQCPLFVGGL